MPPSLSTRNLKDSAVFLTSSKHIRLMLIHPRPPHGVPKRHTPDAMNFLKRDRQLSLSSRPYRQTRNQLTPTPNLTTKPQTQGLRRPRLSSFRCNCQTATRQGQSTEADRHTRKLMPSSRRPACKARLELQFLTSRASRLRRPKILRPRLSAGRSTLEKSRNPPPRRLKGPPSRRRTRYRPRLYFCQRSFARNFSAVDVSGETRRFACIFMPPRGRSVTRCCGMTGRPSTMSKRNARRRFARTIIAS
jgi:hypothetical protein